MYVYIFCLSGTLKKVYFKSNASVPVVTDVEVQVPGVFLVTTVYNESAGAPATLPSQFTPAWTPRAPPHSGDQSHRNASKCEAAEQECLGFRDNSCSEVTLSGHTTTAIHSESLDGCPSFQSEVPAALPARLRWSGRQQGASISELCGIWVHHDEACAKVTYLEVIKSVSEVTCVFSGPLWRDAPSLQEKDSMIKTHLIYFGGTPVFFVPCLLLLEGTVTRHLGC